MLDRLGKPEGRQLATFRLDARHQAGKPRALAGRERAERLVVGEEPLELPWQGREPVIGRDHGAEGLAHQRLEHELRLRPARTHEGDVEAPCEHAFERVVVQRLLERQPGQELLQRRKELLRDERRIGEIGERRDVLDAARLERIVLLQEPRLDVLRRSHHARARERGEHVPLQVRRQGVDHRREQHIDLAMLLAREQLPVVPGDALHRVAAIHRAAALRELAALLLGSVRGERDLPSFDAQCPEQAHPELMGGPHVEHFRNPDPQLRPVLGRDGSRLRGPFPQYWDEHVSPLPSGLSPPASRSRPRAGPWGRCCR